MRYLQETHRGQGESIATQPFTIIVNYSILATLQISKITQCCIAATPTRQTLVYCLQVLTALEKKYHPEHFVCIKCKQPIKENNFRQHEGEPVCEADYAKFFLKKCAACKLPIKGVSQLWQGLNPSGYKGFCFVKHNLILLFKVFLNRHQLLSKGNGIIVLEAFCKKLRIFKEF